MIPGNSFTTSPVARSILYLGGLQYTPLTQQVMGGIALNDPSKGRLYQQWTVNYDGSHIVINPISQAAVFTLAAAGVTSVSLAFDNNMGVVIAWTTGAGANLYYYDTPTAMYITRYFPDISSCRVCVDDPREFNSGQSDVMFGYMYGGNLCYRQQRDRYDIQYTIQPSSKQLVNMGFSDENRLQFNMFG